MCSISVNLYVYLVIFTLPFVIITLTFFCIYVILQLAPWKPAFIYAEGPTVVCL